MKSLWMLPVAAMVMGWSVLAVAEEPASPPAPTEHKAQVERPQRPGAFLERLHEEMDKLQLNDEQKAKVEQLVTSGRENIRKLIEQAKADGKPESREAVRAAIEKLRQDVLAVLSDEQKAKLKEMIEKNRPTTRPGTGAMADRFKANLAKLDLSEQQKESIEKVAADTKAKVDAILQEAGGKTQGLREKIQPVLEAAREQIKSILTPEQFEKLKQLQEAQRPGGEMRPRGDRRPNGEAPKTDAPKADAPQP